MGVRSWPRGRSNHRNPFFLYMKSYGTLFVQTLTARPMSWKEPFFHGWTQNQSEDCFSMRNHIGRICCFCDRARWPCLPLWEGFVCPAEAFQCLEAQSPERPAGPKGENPLAPAVLQIPEQKRGFRVSHEARISLLSPFAASGGPFSGFWEGESDVVRVTMRPLHGGIPGQAGKRQYIPCGDADRPATTEPHQADFVPRAEMFSNMPRINQADPTLSRCCWGKTADFDDCPCAGSAASRLSSWP